MGIQIREVESEEMKKNIRTVRQMTKGMCFDENMGCVNWSFVRAISNFGYQFMPKEKDVNYCLVIIRTFRQHLLLVTIMKRFMPMQKSCTEGVSKQILMWSS